MRPLAFTQSKTYRSHKKPLGYDVLSSGIKLPKEIASSVVKGYTKYCPIIHRELGIYHGISQRENQLPHGRLVL